MRNPVFPSLKLACQRPRPSLVRMRHVNSGKIGHTNRFNAVSPSSSVFACSSFISRKASIFCSSSKSMVTRDREQMGMPSPIGTIGPSGPTHAANPRSISFLFQSSEIQFPHGLPARSGANDPMTVPHYFFPLYSALLMMSDLSLAALSAHRNNMQTTQKTVYYVETSANHVITYYVATYTRRNHDPGRLTRRPSIRAIAPDSCHLAPHSNSMTRPIIRPTFHVSPI